MQDVPIRHVHCWPWRLNMFHLWPWPLLRLPWYSRMHAMPCWALCVGCSGGRQEPVLQEYVLHAMSAWDGRIGLECHTEYHPQPGTVQQCQCHHRRRHVSVVIRRRGDGGCISARVRYGGIEQRLDSIGDYIPDPCVSPCFGLELPASDASSSAAVTAGANSTPRDGPGMHDVHSRATHDCIWPICMHELPQRPLSEWPRTPPVQAVPPRPVLS